MRKMIHYASSAIPIGYLFIEKNIVLLILGGILLLMLVVEFFKYKSNFVYDLYLTNFRHMLREHEYDRTRFRINGASWVIFAAILCILIFPKLIAVTGLLMLAFADSTSALLGRLFGKKQYAPNRSYVGTVTFFAVGIIIMFLTPKYFYTAKEYIITLIAVIATTAADASSLPVDDNFTIPVVCCTVMYVLYLLLYPGIGF
ncbi:MAG: dolichol kinase [Chlorobi bacterium OLB5]|nr:MAG: dolichol kinase [Chlorobi bacterium OLB5]